MSKFIKIGKELVEVTDEVYKAYYQGARRERYFSSDIKVGRIDVDMENQTVVFVSSKEDSFERLIELGSDFPSASTIEDMAEWYVDKDNLYNAISQLNPCQQELLQKVYFQGRSNTSVAEELGISRQALNSRLNKIYSNLKKNFI